MLDRHRLLLHQKTLRRLSREETLQGNRTRGFHLTRAQPLSFSAI